MNMMPPMVGVPCFVMCQTGPSSRMAWPALALRSAGMMYRPDTTVTASDITNASTS